MDVKSLHRFPQIYKVMKTISIIIGIIISLTYSNCFADGVIKENKENKKHSFIKKNKKKIIDITTTKSFLIEYGKLNFTEKQLTDINTPPIAKDYSLTFIKRDVTKETRQKLPYINLFENIDSIQYISDGNNIYVINHKKKEVIIKNMRDAMRFIESKPLLCFYTHLGNYEFITWNNWTKQKHNIRKRITDTTAIISVFSLEFIFGGYFESTFNEDALLVNHVYIPVSSSVFHPNNVSLQEIGFIKQESHLTDIDLTEKPSYMNFDYKTYSQGYNIIDNRK